jgi:predicted lipoprotein with Yx(FWY)xxD motif
MAEEISSVKTASNATLGTFLVNETGFSLYYFAKDAPGNGTSTCYDKCAQIWPPFYVEHVTVSPDLNPADFTTIERTDGTKQIAFKGWPLYYYHLDMKAGDVFGQGVNDVWFVVDPMRFPPK